MSTSDGSTAANILTAALGHMRERAATYDKPEGERSMGATVDAFLAVTGVSMTEEHGWLFMALLKAVRSQQGAYRADSYEDGAAYFALAGEAAVRDRNGGWDDKAIKASALPRCGPMCATCHTIHGTQDRCPAIEPASAIEDDSERMQAIGQNGEMASEVYAAVDTAVCQPDPGRWMIGDSVECISSNYSFITVGTVYVITGFYRNMVQFLDDDGTEMEYERAHFKFHSRPSA